MLSCPAPGRPLHLEGEAADPIWQARTNRKDRNPIAPAPDTLVPVRVWVARPP